MAFSPGQSGNPQGRPKSSANGTKLLDQNSRKILRQLIEKAVAGDLKAIELCLDRIMPRLKARSASIELNAEPGASLADQGRSILEAAYFGIIDSAQALSLMNGLAAQARIVETSDLEQRIEALERQGNQSGSVQRRPLTKQEP